MIQSLHFYLFLDSSHVSVNCVECMTDFSEETVFFLTTHQAINRFSTVAMFDDAVVVVPRQRSCVIYFGAVFFLRSFRNGLFKKALDSILMGAGGLSRKPICEPPIKSVGRARFKLAYLAR